MVVRKEVVREEKEAKEETHPVDQSCRVDVLVVGWGGGEEGRGGQ